jgi:hypothetical protein
MAYQQQWGASNPGCLIMLLDQSGSMSDPFGNSQAGSGRRKCDMVATILNSFLNELIVTNTVVKAGEAPEVRPRADIAVIGYEGTSVSSALGGNFYKDFVTLPELQNNPLRIEQRERQEVDDAGNILKIPMDFPIWVEPHIGGGTPMCAALQRGFDLAQEWANEHQHNYPPVLINVTDGMATDGDPRTIVDTIYRISTFDGQALLFNVHITDINSSPVAYPANEYELPNDKYAHLLFSMSSVIPDTSRALLSSLLGRPVEQGARGLIFNGDAASVRLMFTFASVPATQPLDPNR